LGSVKKEAGFTLIELLVAIGILSILVAIAIFNYQNYRVRAFDIAAKSDLKNATTVLETYHLAIFILQTILICWQMALNSPKMCALRGMT